MQDQPISVLFVCAGNSIRSILAECLLNQWGRGTFVAYSAGSHPKGWVHPFALKLLEYMRFPTHGLRSKSWDEFAAPGAPSLDFVISVCDKSVSEFCPAWPGQPMSAHWEIADPTSVRGTQQELWAAFRTAFTELDSRIKIFTSLPLRSLDRIRLQQHLDAIGGSRPADQVA